MALETLETLERGERPERERISERTRRPREREKSRNAHGALLATVTAQHTKVATVSGQGTLIDHVKRTWTDPHVHALGAAGHAWEFFGMKRNAPSGVERL